MSIWKPAAVVAAITLAPFGAAHANAAAPEDLIRANLLRAGEKSVGSITPSPVKGLYAVSDNGHTLYVDASGTRVIQGEIFDMQTRENLTEKAAIAALPRVDWKSLPLKDAIVTVKGNGKRKLAVFSDPDCPYCHMLEEKSLPEISNVTIYTFLYPLDGLHPDATRKARLLWCAPDHAAAWDAWMHHGVLPSNAGTCDTPLARNAALGATLHVNGTPGLVFFNGAQVPGAQQASVIEKHLEAVR
ncbi:DsbC family protein [Paraburkholderia unamae]|uniref:Thiol:disulfide interchange protein n=1 Tax=Paraburkholderia unamae TaxID=219649 RepID=A0ABX5KWF8_9BURK|nr:DsbC family protein [Paraburkholderia unamae]PVX85825.1 thiol:disulfide interchange protein DsbC [Paraburkholderia unamae]